MDDSLQLLLRSVVIGLSIAAPVGPIGVLCIRRTLAGGRLVGLVSGLGAATADAFYGAVAAFGITLISTLLVEQAVLLRLGGALFLAYLGLRTLLAVPQDEAAYSEQSGRGILGAYSSTFFLTLTNPMTILAFMGIFAGLGADAPSGGGASALLMVGGVFMGSALWWSLLSGGVSLLRARFDARLMRWVNRASGAVILVFAADILLGLPR